MIKRMGYMGQVAQTRSNGVRLPFLTELRTTPAFTTLTERRAPHGNSLVPIMTGGALSIPEGRRGPRRRLTRGPVLPRTGSLLIPPNWRVRPREPGPREDSDGRPRAAGGSEDLARPLGHGRLRRSGARSRIVWWPVVAGGG